MSTIDTIVCNILNPNPPTNERDAEMFHAHVRLATSIVMMHAWRSSLDQHRTLDPNDVAKLAVKDADALIAELSK